MRDVNGSQEKQKAAKVRRQPEPESMLRPTFAAARQETSGTLWDRNHQGSGLLQRQCACGTHTIGGGECDGCRQKREPSFLQRTAIKVTPADNMITGQSRGAASLHSSFVRNFSQISVHIPASQRVIQPKLTRSPMIKQLKPTNDVIQRRPVSQVVTDLEARLSATPADLNGYMQTIRTEAGQHAGDTALRATIAGHLSASRITLAQAWRAVCLQVLGPETNWSLVFRNFVQGVEGGQFTPPSGMPPASEDALREQAILTAHTAATGSGVFAQYQGLFNSRWESSRFSGFSAEFDPTLDSKGPRTQRSREIFNEIYNSNSTIRTAYDTNAGNIRQHIDQYVGPESRNIIASPRLQSLRAMFRTRSLITSSNLSHPAYVAFKNLITPTAQSLDVNDRTEIEGSHEWRLIIDRTVRHETLRSDLTNFLATAWQSAPAPTTPPPATATTTTTASAPTPLSLTADQRAFVSGLSLQGPTSPINSNNAEEQLDFRPQSVRNPAGLNIDSKVEVTPSSQITEGAETQHLWPPSASVGHVHSATTQVDGGTSGFTDFTATLTLVPRGQGAISLTPPQTTVRVQDQRQAWFITNIKHGLIFSDQNEEFIWSPGDHIEYFGGQQPLSVKPFLGTLSARQSNRGLAVFVKGEISKSGTVIQNFPLVEFGRTAQSRHLGGVIVLETTPPATTPDAMELKVEFFSSNNTSSPAFHSITQPFQIHPGTAFTNTQLLAQAQSDHTDLNSTAAGSILDDMTNMGGQASRISQAIQGGAIQLEPSLVRPDSAAFLRANPSLGNPSNAVAYLVGHTVIDNHHTLVGQPGADAWRWGRFPTSIFINLTPSLANPSHKRPNSEIIPFIVHESVHALDNRPASNTFIERYKTEFRAYWMDGEHDRRPGSGSSPGPLRSTAFDPSMDNRGPKSEKARAIFNHLYGSPTYPWVSQHYDANINHFREQVNAFIVPDGINLIVSQTLENVRAAIEGFSGSGFSTHRSHLQTLYSGTSALDRQEISGNRYWRELVERKYSSSQENLIKTDLNIPQ